MTVPGGAPWDLELEVIDVLGDPGCGWNYAPGYRARWDGRHFPEGMCPFAWNAFAPLIWAQRYAAGHRSLGYESGDEITLLCPDPRHQVLWRIRRLRPGGQMGQAHDQGGRIWRLSIEVDALPAGPGCDRGYQVGDRWEYDGSVPEGLCPLAWQALSLWVWPLRYGASPAPMEWTGDSVRYNCPNAANPVVFHVQRTVASSQTIGGA